MEKEPPKPPAERPASPEEPALRDDVHVAASRARCPFCHEAVSPEATDWVACRGCLARHHVGCWGEHGACSACGEAKFLPATPGRARSSARPRAALIVGLLVALFTGGVLVSRPPTERAVDRPARSDGRPRLGACADSYTRLESYHVVAVNPTTRKSLSEPLRELYLDEYAELLAAVVHEGYTDLRSPTADVARKVIQQVHDQARRRYTSDEEPRLQRLKDALDALERGAR